MPEPRKFKKTGGGDTHEIAAAFLIVAILVTPFVVAYVPRILSFEEAALNAFLAFWRGTVRPIAFILDAILFVFLAGILIAVWPIRYFAPGPFARAPRRERGKPAGKDAETVQRFAALKTRAAVPTTENLRLAVIEGDALVDTFLKRAGYGGEHMADRLSAIDAHEAPAVEGCWDAHRLRNTLVHTPGAAVSVGEAKNAIAAYEKFLKELGAL